MEIVKEAEEKVVTEGEVKTPELCAIPKSFIVDKLNALYQANKEVFDEYNLFVNVLNSQVNVVNQEETI